MVGWAHQSAASRVRPTCVVVVDGKPTNRPASFDIVLDDFVSRQGCVRVSIEELAVECRSDDPSLEVAAQACPSELERELRDPGRGQDNADIGIRKQGALEHATGLEEFMPWGAKANVRRLPVAVDRVRVQHAVEVEVNDVLPGGRQRRAPSPLMGQCSVGLGSPDEPPDR